MLLLKQSLELRVVGGFANLDYGVFLFSGKLGQIGSKDHFHECIKTVVSSLNLHVLAANVNL